MPSSTSRGLRYPLLTETANVPRDVGNLAADADRELLAIRQPPTCRAVLSAAQSVASGTPAAAVYQSATGTAGMWSAGSPTRITVAQAGRYLLQASATWAANATGDRGMMVRVNGAGGDWVAIGGTATTGFGAVQSGGIVLQLTAGQYVEVLGLQTSGAALNLNGVIVTLTWLSE